VYTLGIIGVLVDERERPTDFAVWTARSSSLAAQYALSWRHGEVTFDNLNVVERMRLSQRFSIAVCPESW
jgi:hypothetical protein